MWIYVLGLPSLAVLYLLFRLSRPISGGKLIEDWTADELADVPRPPISGSVAFLPNGWYCVADEEDLTAQHTEESPLVVKAIGKTFRLWRDGDDVMARTAGGTWFLVDRSHTMILVWYDAQQRAPNYRVQEGHAPIPAGMVSHGKLVHTVRSLLQDIPENGADYAHFAAVHEDGSTAFGWVARLLQLRLIFDGHWEANVDQPARADARVANHIQVLGRALTGTRQTVEVTQVGPSVVFEDSPHGVTGGRILLVQSVTPLGPHRHLEQTRVFAAPGLWARIGVHLFMRGFGKNLEADIMMQNNKKYLAAPLLVRGDGPIGKFRRWFAQFYSADSPRTAEQFFSDEV